MGMGVFHRLVNVLMAVLAEDFFVMLMVMMAVVMAVPVLMNFFGMDVRMRMFFGDREIGSGQHDCQSGQEGASVMASLRMIHEISTPINGAAA